MAKMIILMSTWQHNMVRDKKSLVILIDKGSIADGSGQQKIALMCY